MEVFGNSLWKRVSKHTPKWQLRKARLERDVPEREPAGRVLFPGELAGQLVTLFTNVKAQGVVQRGPIDGSVVVGQVGGETATATTCLDQTLTRLYDRAGTARPGSSGTRSQFAVTLTRVGGTWKVSNVKNLGADCTLPK